MRSRCSIRTVVGTGEGPLVESVPIQGSGTYGILMGGGQRMGDGA